MNGILLMNHTNAEISKILELKSALACSPKNETKKWKRPQIYCGEDSYFMSNDQTKEVYAFGIADGGETQMKFNLKVGGWSEVGVDPSDFSCELMNECEKYFKTNYVVSPKDILINGYNELVKNKLVEAGSSTACILTIDLRKGGAIMKSANLGDSGFLVVRDNSVKFKTKEQQHFFNAPFQLSVIPPQMRSRGNIVDKPEDSEEYELNLKNGDYIVLSTDGLFDNVWEDEIVQVIKSQQNIGTTQDISNELVKLAQQRSRHLTNATPFSESAKNAGYQFRGGKVDDITVVVIEIK